MTADARAAIAAIRSGYIMAGSPNGPACASADCLFIAEWRVFWPVSPGEEYPLYCAACAERARRVLEALGQRCDAERLPPRPQALRGLDLRDEVDVGGR